MQNSTPVPNCLGEIYLFGDYDAENVPILVKVVVVKV